MAFTACLLWAAKPRPCRAAASHGQGGLQCLLAPISTSWTSPLDCRIPAPAARGQGSQSSTCCRDGAGHGWHIAPRPRNGAFTCPAQSPQRTDCRSAFQTLLPGGTRLEAAVGYTPAGYCPCLLSAQGRETPNTSGSCSGTSQPSTCSSPVTIAGSTGLPSLSFLPLLSTLNYHNTAVCQWACPGSVSHAASPREACNLSSALTPNFPCSNKCHRLIIHYANHFLVTLQYVVVSLEPLLRSAKKKIQPS